MDSLRSASRTRFGIRVLAVLLSLVALHAAEQQALEYQVKAAFLLKFTGFVEWPAGDPGSAGTPFAICIVGEDPFGHVLDQIVEGEAVAGRRIVVRRIHRDAVNGCGVVYFAAQEKNVAELLNSAGPGVLTVGEGDTFLDQGGMIAFAVENHRVRFDANPAAAKKAGLKLSSRLLNVARIVR